MKNVINVNGEIGMEKKILNIIKKNIKKNEVIKVHGNEFEFLKDLSDKRKKEICNKPDFFDNINHELNMCISTRIDEEINFKGNHFKTNEYTTTFTNDLFLKNFLIDMSVYEKENNKYSKYIENICLPMLEKCYVKNRIFYVFNEDGDISNAKQQVTLTVTTKDNIEEIKENFEKSEKMTDDQKMKLDLLVKIKKDMAEKNIKSNDFQLTFEGDYVYALYGANLVIYKKDEKEKKYSMHRQYNLDNENMKMSDLTFYEDRIFLLGEKCEQNKDNNYFFVFDKNCNLQTKLRVSENKNIQKFCKSKCIDCLDCLPLININDYSYAKVVDNYKDLDKKKKKYFDKCVAEEQSKVNNVKTSLSEKKNCIII